MSLIIKVSGHGIQKVSNNNRVFRYSKGDGEVP
jgi:hypothetical protein